MKIYGYCPYPDLAAQQPLVEDAPSTTDKPRRRKVRAIPRSYVVNALAAMNADKTDRRHGTLTGYHYGCRCERCCLAQKKNYASKKRRD